MSRSTRTRRALRLTAVLTAAVGLVACSSGTRSGTAASGASGAGSTVGAAATQVLPVADNPIHNTSTVDALKIDSVLVENNVDATTGKPVDDHLEIALTNTGSTPLTHFEIFYTFTDQTSHAAEKYYLALPETFTIAPGGTRTAQLDNSGAPDHFPVSNFSLFKTSRSELAVAVTVSATDARPVTTTVTKGAGGAEQAD